ncbi:MAG: dihydroorotase [Elusimicrobiota bacterium]|nr:dihydroorotase [Elusimicrobiota bacterium]
MSESLIVGGLVVDPSQKLEAVRDVLVRDGRVVEVAAGLSKRTALKGVETVDAKGLWVIPGLVDMHVHLREPGRESDETIATGTKAAAAGGVTTVLAMANTEPVTDNPSQLAFLRAKAAQDAVVTVLFAGAVTLGQKGERLTEFAKLRAAGAAALSDDGRPLMNAGLMRRALEHAKDAGLLVIDHCEDLTLSNGACVHEGPSNLAKGLKGSPAAAETVQVLRDVALAELTGGRVHLAHLSSAASVEAVRLAKKRGVRVSAEAAPHHFALDESMIPGYDAAWKMNPPLREKSDREALLEGLSDGTLDAIATDHAPHGCAAKSLGMDQAPFGVIGLEASLAVALTELYHKKVLDKKRLVARLSAAPAALLGLKDKGTLEKGAAADVVLVDPDAVWTPAPPFRSKSRNTPFAGRRLKGRAVKTFVAGRLVHDAAA